MELGRIAQIDNARENYEVKSQQVSTVSGKMKAIQEEEYKKNASKEPISELNEVILDNVKFGYNKPSKDFFVKVIRGDAEIKYPTEDMMRAKARLLQELKESQNN